MAKQIVWSLKAQEDRKNILSYWRQRNGSAAYSKKLHFLFKEAINIISKFPQIGRPTDHRNVRVKVVRDYLIIYEDTEKAIYILAIWDSRQDPNKLEELLK
jgi:toxin YoeB